MSNSSKTKSKTDFLFNAENDLVIVLTVSSALAILFAIQIYTII